MLDLAARFADGRLTTEKLLSADDEELYDMLIAVRGIGKVCLSLFCVCGANLMRFSGLVCFYVLIFELMFVFPSVDMFAIFSLRRPDILPIGEWLNIAFR